MTGPFEVQLIATVVGGRTEVADDYWGGIQSIIRLDDRFPAETLQGLDAFSHLVVTWAFHLASPDDVALHVRSPRGNPAWPATGTFVHRNHRRPNQLATSFPRVLKVDGRDIHVTDLDAVDGTPVIDLAPFFGAMGPQGPIHEPQWPGEMLGDYWANSGAVPGR
ncbi:SAM-dependent methyltransferase [Actinacidiphila glaucinigra]|uniref:SAM-dependent methyltransferase n=1 Tax=Actinacidiphila glaucinigra TaxID=235986 RepID=UPI0037CC8CF7